MIFEQSLNGSLWYVLDDNEQIIKVFHTSMEAYRYIEKKEDKDVN